MDPRGRKDHGRMARRRGRHDDEHRVLGHDRAEAGGRAMRTSLAALVIFSCMAAAAQTDPLKSPAGCRPAKDAKPSLHGYADRVIHEKTGIELILLQPGKFIM